MMRHALRLSEQKNSRLTFQGMTMFAILPRNLCSCLCLTMMLTGLCKEADVFAEDSPSSLMRVYIGTYTTGDSQGIYTFTLNTKTGQVSEPVLAAEIANPSFVAFSPDRQFLYCVNEVAELPGPRNQKVGGVSAFKIDPTTGKLTHLNSQLTGGIGPCHLTVDQTGQCVIVANYNGGSVACLPILKDGSLGELTSFIQHTGASINPRRQSSPHAHSANVDVHNKHVVIADLGLDKLMVYQLDSKAGKLTANTPPSISTQPGVGPRHLSFHPNGRWAYSNNELGNSVSAYDYDADGGVFETLATLSTLPANNKITGSTTAETLVHPNGKFVYVSNRGHDSIASFKVLDDGTLEAIGHTSTQGKTPRNFGIDPTGKFLIAANQNSSSLVVFRINEATGELTPTGDVLSVSNPCCVRMLPIE